MIKRALLFCFLTCFASAAFAQTAVTAPAPAVAPITQAWSVNTSAVALPGGKNSIAGTDAGVTFTPSQNLDLASRNLFTTDGFLKYFAGQFRYRLPSLSIAANNASDTQNLLGLQFYLTGSFGLAQVSGKNHYGWTGGAGVNYQLTKGGAWTMGGQAEYADFPDYGGKAIIEANAAFHF